MVGLIFFFVYGISNIVAARIYDKFKEIPLNHMLNLSFISQAILLFLFTYLKDLVIIVGLWFIYELIFNTTMIYSEDRINKSLITHIGKRLSRFRITVAIGSILGQIVISRVWDTIGVNESFYFSSATLIILSILITFRKKIVYPKNNL